MADAATAVVVSTSPAVTCKSDTATPGAEVKLVIEVPGETPTLPTIPPPGTLFTVEAPRMVKLVTSEPITDVDDAGSALVSAVNKENANPKNVIRDTVNSLILCCVE